MLKVVDCRKDGEWLKSALDAVAVEGYCVIEGVLDGPLIERIREAMYRAQKQIWREVGEEKLKAAGELGVLRLMVKYDPVFLRLLEIPEMLQIVDNTVGTPAVLHLQNGFILPSLPAVATPKVFQNQFHMDFRRFLNGYVASVNCLIAIDGFSEENGATIVVPRSHQQPSPPSGAQLDGAAVPVACGCGAMIVFDSTLWHAAGSNTSGADRLAINHQFTRSWIKQQVDYVRALGEDLVIQQPARTQQLLGYYTRVVTSLDEYYRPKEARLYRADQG